MGKTEYIIVGDTEKFNDCLVCTCGESKERANKILNRMLTNLNENEKRLIEGHRNLRIKEIPKSECWWNGNCD